MTPDEIAAEFAARLDAFTPIIHQELEWPAMRLRARTFVEAIELPPALVTSARAVVFKGSKVVVVRDAFGHSHVEPGGRLEPGETAEQAVRRELLEETGWTVGALTPLGFHHFRPLGEPPPNLRHRWGDFVQPLYVAEAVRYDRKARDRAQIELGSRLTPIGRAFAELDPWRRPLLDAAIERRRSLSSPE